MESTNVRLEGWLQHASSQPLEVQLLEEGVFLHFAGTTSTTPQALSGVLAQELQRGKGGQGGLGETAAAHPPNPRSPHLAGLPPDGRHTWEQSERACGEKRSEYSSGTSFTNRSTSSRLIFFFLCWKGDWPAIIS